MGNDAHWAVRSFLVEDGAARLGVVAKREYRIVLGRRVEPIAAPAPIRTAPEFVRARNGQRLLQHDSDLFAFVKLYTDVVLPGTAHSRCRPVPVLETGLCAGPV